jgi:NADH:ubiquinone oxidoreductase subunit 4 (subunit M)
MIMLVATDFGRWLSAVVFCNFFAIGFLLRRDVINVEELIEYSGGVSSLLFAGIFLTYLVFGPLHDWNPYPYQHDVISSSLAVVSVLTFDILFWLRWRSLGRAPRSEQ